MYKLLEDVGLIFELVSDNWCSEIVQFVSNIFKIFQEGIYIYIYYIFIETFFGDLVNMLRLHITAAYGLQPL